MHIEEKRAVKNDVQLRNLRVKVEEEDGKGANVSTVYLVCVVIWSSPDRLAGDGSGNAESGRGVAHVFQNRREVALLIKEKRAVKNDVQLRNQGEEEDGEGATTFCNISNLCGDWALVRST